MEGTFKNSQIYFYFIIFAINFEEIKSLTYCSSTDLISYTIQVTCEYDRERIPCETPLYVGTRVTIACHFGYTLPDRRIKEVIVCNEFGEWDYPPFRCEPNCGTEPDFITFNPIFNNNNVVVPWHALIIRNYFSEKFSRCSGTIISDKILLAESYCFRVMWFANSRPSTEKFYNGSSYHVEIGKFQRNNELNESIQHFQITELYFGVNESSPIAIVVLDKPIKFSRFIKPICIEWQTFENQLPKPDTIGRTSGWGLGVGRNDMLSGTNFKTITKEVCIEKVFQYGNDLHDIAFCAVSQIKEDRCDYESGSGFFIPKILRGIKKYYLSGIILQSLNYKEISECYIIVRNIQLYSSDINEYVTKYRLE